MAFEHISHSSQEAQPLGTSAHEQAPLPQVQQPSLGAEILPEAGPAAEQPPAEGPSENLAPDPGVRSSAEGGSVTEAVDLKEEALLLVADQARAGLRGGSSAQAEELLTSMASQAAALEESVQP